MIWIFYNNGYVINILQKWVIKHDIGRITFDAYFLSNVLVFFDIAILSPSVQ